MISRLDQIRLEAQRLVDITHYVIGIPDVFGEPMTVAIQNEAIRNTCARINTITLATDAEWDAEMQSTADEVAEADHPKHSVITHPAPRD